MSKKENKTAFTLIQSDTTTVIIKGSKYVSIKSVTSIGNKDYSSAILTYYQCRKLGKLLYTLGGGMDEEIDKEEKINMKLIDFNLEEIKRK